MDQRTENIVDKAIKKIEQETGLHFTPKLYGDHDGDLELLLIDYDIALKAQVKTLINKEKLGMIKNELERIGDETLLITTYVNPKMMEFIKELKINFIDTAGNAFIDKPPIYINIKGNKPDEINKRVKRGRVFQAAGLQVIFVLLCLPGLENKPFREIAARANVALGTVHFVLKELENLGFIINMEKKKKRLINKDRLLLRWVEQYPERLKPKFALGKYRMNDNDFWRKLNIENFNSFWGGETAAAILTNYLKPFFHTVYIDKKLGEFILKNKLRKDENGNLEIVKIFWNFDYFGYPNIVHPILIYADLITTGDPRNIETANLIYEREIARYIK